MQEDEPPHDNPVNEGTSLAPGAAGEAVQPGPGAAEADVAAVWNMGDVILDLYEVKQVHEGGGMGLVYRVHHRTWNIDLAVKSPRPEYFQSEDQKENFQREAETWVNLDLHPNIVSCQYVRRLGGIPRIFAEYIEGGSLSQWIRERKLYEGGPQQALRRILDIAIQMAWGLHFAHEQGLVHQDVKPANVMMTPDGVAKVTDFGLARARAVAGEGDMAPADGSILVSRGGMTPPYASPEQMAGKKLSRKTDIWSWAVSVLEMFTSGVTWGAGPAAGEAFEEYLKHGPEEGLPAMPDGLADLLRRCFAWEPEERPKDMEEVAAALQDVYRETMEEPYLREVPHAVKLLADGLNNRALSMLDLGKAEESERLWEEALKTDPQHLHATYNRGLHVWRSARMADDELVRQLEAVRTTAQGDWEADYLLGLVHLERGDVKEATALLEEAARVAGEREVVSTLKAVRERKETTPGCLGSLKGHSDGVWSVALTPDGRLAVTGSSDKTVRLWELATRRWLNILKGHSSTIWCVALTADGYLALSGSEDGALRVWELSTGRCLRILHHEPCISSLALTPDGQFALSGSDGREDNTLRLWEVATGRCLRTVKVSDRVRSVALTPDGRFGLSGGYDNVLRLWELATGRCLRSFEGHIAPVYSVALTPEGRFALSGSSDATLRLWVVATGECLRTLRGHTASVNAVGVAAGGRLAVTGSSDKTVRLWDLASGRCLCIFAAGTEVCSVAVTSDGRLALSGGLDRIARLWRLDLEHRPNSPWSYARPRPTVALEEEAKAVRHVLARSEPLLAQGDFRAAAAELRAARALEGYQRHSGLLKAWAWAGHGGRRETLLGGWKVRILRGHSKAITSVTMTPDGRFALSGSDDKTLRLWEIASGRCLRTLTGHKNSIGSVVLTPDGRFGCSESWWDTVRLWELDTGHCLRSIESRDVLGVALTADNRFAFWARRGNTTRLQELATGHCLGMLQEYGYRVTLAAGGRLALSTRPRSDTVRLWELATGRSLGVLRGHSAEVTSVAVTSDGRFALSASLDKTLRLWNLATCRCVRTLKGHGGSVLAVALTADGRFALAGGADNSIRLWELASGRCLRTLRGHIESYSWDEGWTRSLQLTPNGRLALSGGDDGTIRLWELDWDYEFPEPADWDEGARPYLETFLTLHTPCAAELPVGREPSEEEIVLALTSRGKPSWTEEDFQGLIPQLQYAGYGWLRPEGVRSELKRMAQDWEGPPPLFGAGGGSFLSRLFGRRG